jgi:hypothetical protein
MKKLAFAFIFCLLIIQFAFSQYAKNEKELYGLKGNVKTIIKESAKIVFESGQYAEMNRNKWRTETYDLQGNLIKEDPIPRQEARPLFCTASGRCNTEEPQIKLTYNKQNKVIEERNVLKDGTITSKREFDYDSKGRTLEWRFYYFNETTDKLELSGKWVYTRNGNETKSTLYEECCKIKRWNIVSFNKNGDIIEMASFKADGSLTTKSSSSYEYDSTGNWIKRIMSVWITRNGKSFFEPVEAHYRTISYYDER